MEEKTIKVKVNICTFSKSELQLAQGRVRAVGRPERDRTMNLKFASPCIITQFM
jgi:hypothetical protein